MSSNHVVYFCTARNIAFHLCGDFDFLATRQQDHSRPANKLWDVLQAVDGAWARVIKVPVSTRVGVDCVCRHVLFFTKWCLRNFGPQTRPFEGFTSTFSPSFAFKPPRGSAGPHCSRGRQARGRPNLPEHTQRFVSPGPRKLHTSEPCAVPPRRPRSRTVFSLEPSTGFERAFN